VGIAVFTYIECALGVAFTRRWRAPVTVCDPPQDPQNAIWILPDAYDARIRIFVIWSAGFARLVEPP
jgi:hypothetical protein